MNLRLTLPLAIVSAAAFAQVDADQPALPEPKPTAEQLAFFESKIRPVLVDKCYKCHSEKAEKIRGGLVLDTRAGIRRGGDNGPAVVPGELHDSLLIDAIRYANKDTAMPPEKSGGKLPDSVIADFEAWVKMGAPDPRDGTATVVKKTDMEEAKKWWAYQAPKKSELPTVKDAAWPRGEIDRFLLAALEAKGLKPVADADKTTLLRRVHFDLVGLPPTLKEIDAFLADTSPDALAKVVDRLLASKHFGERWGRHWLDVARYAESSGKDVNLSYPHAWRYRDYVIAAFNEGKPFDDFIREQVAGDLLPAKDDRDKAENLVATGFLAIGAKGHNEQNPRQFYLDLADEQIDTLSQALLGVTVACARCHDHKFDPIPQRDYYALAGIFLSTDTEYGTARGLQNRHPSELIELPSAAQAPIIERRMTSDERGEKEKRLAELQKELTSLFAQGRPGAGGPAARPELRQPQNQVRVLQLVTQVGLLEAELKSFDESGTPKPLAMGTKDLPASQSEGFAAFGRRGMGMGGPGMRFGGFRPPEFASIAVARLYARGDADKPTDRVPRGVPAALSAERPLDIPNGTSGRRELAEWLVSKSNPLTARVFVNRTWHWLFGRGLVESCDNFGTTGAKPANSALLDTLAVNFMNGGWNVKALIRDIVLSRAYALSSSHDARSFEADPENTLVWRANKRRLHAECVRDAMLFASGDLYPGVRVGSLIADNGDGPIGGPRGGGFFGGRQAPGTREDDILESTGNYRSVYLPVARDVAPDSLTVFDFVDSTFVSGARESTNVPVQALYLLNGEFVAEQSALLAERVMKAYPAGPNGGMTANLDQRTIYAYWLVFNRAPDAVEKQAAASFFAKFPSNYAKGDTSAPGVKKPEQIKAAWTSFCRALFAAAEFRYLN